MGIFLYEQDLFEGSLYENIALGRTGISSESILDLAKKLGFDNLIPSFPNFLDTPIDPLVNKLPSTSITKILLLRALINDPILLILEEPWKNLDIQSTSIIQDYLIDKAKNATIIISTDDENFKSKCGVNFQIEP
jgi:ABC-type multidrug transport system fused ATPase/permease subunit